MRRLALAAALLVVPVVPAHSAGLTPASAAPRIETRVYVFDRVHPKAPMLAVKAVVETGGDYALGASAAAIVGRDGRYYKVSGGGFMGVTSGRKSVVGPTSGLPVCSVDPNVHHCQEPTGEYTWWMAGDGLYNRLFVILHGRIKSVGFTVPDGWRQWRLTGHVSLVAGSETVTVQPAQDYRFGQFDGRVTAAGGPHGSIALGHPVPCSYFGMGTGDVWLRGGQVDVEDHCTAPPYRNVAVPVSYADGRTTWTYEGTTTGWSDVPIRLLVMDLP